MWHDILAIGWDKGTVAICAKLVKAGRGQHARQQQWSLHGNGGSCSHQLLATPHLAGHKRQRGCLQGHVLHVPSNKHHTGLWYPDMQDEEHFPLS